MSMSSGKRRGGTRWKLVRDRAFRRDAAKQAPCWICGRPIDYAAKPGEPYAWEPDHYLPVSRYPELEYDIDNIRPAHSSCNRRRKDSKGSGKESLGTQSRRW